MYCDYDPIVDDISLLQCIVITTCIGLASSTGNAVNHSPTEFHPMPTVDCNLVTFSTGGSESESGGYMYMHRYRLRLRV